MGWRQKGKQLNLAATPRWQTAAGTTEGALCQQPNDCTKQITPMDLSELAREERPMPHATAQPVDPYALVNRLGGDIAYTLLSAEERVGMLVNTGRIDRSSLQLLRDEIGRARRVAIMGQQVGRYASGNVRLVRERLDLTNLLKDALGQRRADLTSRGLTLRESFVHTEVMADGALTDALLQSMLDWALEHAISRIDLRLDIKTRPAHARLVCAFAHRTNEVHGGTAALDDSEPSALETMSWCLMQQAAMALGLALYRHDTHARATLTLEFPDTVVQRIDGLLSSEVAGSLQQAYVSQPMAGRHVLVLSAHRDVRNDVREALRPMGMMIDFVGSIEEAELFCHDGLPHAVVYEAALGGERFERLRAAMLAEVSTLAFVQIAPEGKAFQMLNVGGKQYASVGRDAIVQGLPGAMMYEMAASEAV